MYPLSVALKSPMGLRKEAADIIMKSMRKERPQLIDEALAVSRELVRVAILWEETWHWGLEEASKKFFAEGNVQGTERCCYARVVLMFL